jgi:lipoprotein NlpD
MRPGVLLMPALIALAGCASSPTPAPVVEADAGRAERVPPTPVGHYRVRPGDTLYRIALDHGLDYRTLAAWNGLTDADRIQAGQLLRVRPPLPPAKTIATPAGAAVRAAGEARAQPASIDQSGARMPLLWTWPSSGPLLARFGDGMNKGIDIGGARGQPVRAAAAGEVVYAGANLRGYGKLIIIRHGEALLSAYAHNQRLLVEEGQVVGLGQLIAEMGDTDADQVKLHFEIREYGKPVDPLNFLPKSS